MSINRTKRKPEQVNPRSAQVYDPLAVVPLVPDNVEQKRDRRGLIHLRLKVSIKGLKKRIAGWLGYKYAKTVELDELGTMFYERVDGRKALRDIAGEMAGKSGHSLAEMNKRVVLFTRSLMGRNMILLQVGKRASRW